MRRVVAYTGIGLSFFTAGLIAGLSFIAAAVKFTAEKPDLLSLLDVGRVQFGALHLSEWVLVPLSCALLLIGLPRLWKPLLLTSACFTVQAFVILPPLHARMIARLAEQPVPESNLHLTYVGVSGALMLLLIAQGAFALVALAKTREVRDEAAASHARTEHGFLALR